MIVAVADGGDEFGHQVRANAGILELIAARAACGEEPVEVGAVIDRTPVGTHVVGVGEALLLAATIIPCSS